MATIQNIQLTENLRTSNPKVNSNFTNINTQLVNHVAGTADKHNAQDIIYTGLQTGENVKSAIDNLKSDFNNLSFTGSEHDALVTSALIDYENEDFGPDGTATYLDGRLTKWEGKVSSHLADFVSVKRYGAIGDDITDDTTAIQNTLNNHKYVKIPEGVYKITSKLVTYPGQIIIGDGIGVSILKKYFNGALINLEKYCGLQNIEIDGNGSLYTGSGIEITAGDNTTIIENQGHQRIDMCQIHDTESWCVEYPNANKGWLSKITRSLLYKPLNKPACVKWPDEPANGGNRGIIDCYSNCPIVDVSGCDNGMINHNTIGGDGTSNQGILFSDSINGAKKIIITNNRIAIVDGSINIKGNNHIINNNIIAGSVVFEPGAIGCKYGIDNIITGSVTDNSGQMNDIYAQKQGFTPVWTSSGTQPSFGNADVRGEYTRIGQRVKFAVYISFGSTTTFGTGTWFFSLPVPKISGITTRFVGSAFLGNQAGVCYIDMNNQKITLYCSTPGTVTYNTPITWASGNQLIFEGEYTL